MHFRYRATYSRHLLSVMWYARSTHAVTTSQLFLPSWKMMKLTAHGCCLSYLVETMGNKWGFFHSHVVRKRNGVTWVRKGCCIWKSVIFPFSVATYSKTSLLQVLCLLCTTEQSDLLGLEQFAASSTRHIRPPSFQGGTGVWWRERWSCEADLGLGLNAGLSPCEGCGSLICAVQ